MRRPFSLLLYSIFLLPFTVHATEQFIVPQGEVLLIRDEALQPESLILEHGNFPAVLVCHKNKPPCGVLLAIDMKATPGTYPFTLALQQPPEVISRDMALVVAKKKFTEQKLTLPPEYVTPDKNAQARIAKENRLIRAALSSQDRRPLNAPFIMPGKGEISGRFGARRILNNLPRSRHSGVDLAINEGDTVLCVGDGKVALTGDFYIGGKSVYINHGSGVYSIYFHLSEIKVKKGAEIKKGSVIGLAGSTGRALGAHLHFAIKVGKVYVDPLQLLSVVNQMAVNEPAKVISKELKEATGRPSAPEAGKSSD